MSDDDILALSDLDDRITQPVIEKLAAFADLRDSLAACLRIVSGMEMMLAAQIYQCPAQDEAYELLENKTTIIAKAREVSARAAKIGGG